jgi:hypothetical protein
MARRVKIKRERKKADEEISTLDVNRMYQREVLSAAVVAARVATKTAVWQPHRQGI